MPDATGPLRSPQVLLARGSGPKAPPLWVWLWPILQRGRLAPGPAVAQSEGQGNTQRRLFRSRRLWELGIHVTGETKARQWWGGVGWQQAAFVAQAEQETGPIVDRQGRLSHTLWLLCSEHRLGQQGQAESGSGPSGDRVTRTRNMSKSTECQEVALVTLASGCWGGNSGRQSQPQGGGKRKGGMLTRSNTALQGPLAFLADPWALSPGPLAHLLVPRGSPTWLWVRAKGSLTPQSPKH